MLERWRFDANELGEVVVKSIFVALLNGELHALVPPQTLESIEAVQRHWIVGADIRIGRKNLSKPLPVVSEA